MTSLTEDSLLEGVVVPYVPDHSFHNESGSSKEHDEVKVVDNGKKKQERKAKKHAKRTNLMEKSILGRLQKGLKAPSVGFTIPAAGQGQKDNSDYHMPSINGPTCLTGIEGVSQDSQEQDVLTEDYCDDAAENVNGYLQLPDLAGGNGSRKITSGRSDASRKLRKNSGNSRSSQRVWETSGRRMDFALEGMKKMWDRHREDNHAGVPKEFSFMQPSFTVVYDDSAVNYKRRKRKNVVTDGQGQGPGRLLTQATISTSKDSGTNKQELSRQSTLTLASRDTNRLGVPGVEWTTGLPDSKCTEEDQGQKKKVHRCKTLYPVTEAMHREGTSVTKTKGRPLYEGEWPVAKVWQRRHINADISPVQMAHEDIVQWENN